MTARHACDPLTAEEIAVAAKAVRNQAGLDASGWFETIALDESDKSRLLAGDPSTRHAYVCCYEPSSHRTFTGLVDLGRGTLKDWRHVPGVQARIVIDEFTEGSRIAKADPAFQEACRKRGITDMDKVLVEAWAAGNFGIAGEEGERLAYGRCWLANDAGDNPYGRPISDLHPVIDLRRRRIVRVDDFGVSATASRFLPDQTHGGFAPRREALGDNPAGRPKLHRRGPRGALAEMAPAHRLQCPRRLDPPRHRL